MRLRGTRWRHWPREAGLGTSRPSWRAASCQSMMALSASARASSRVSPSPMQPGKAGTVASQPPPSAAPNGSTMIAYSICLAIAAPFDRRQQYVLLPSSSMEEGLGMVVWPERWARDTLGRRRQLATIARPQLARHHPTLLHRGGGLLASHLQPLAFRRHSAKPLPAPRGSHGGSRTVGGIPCRPSAWAEAPFTFRRSAWGP